MTQVISNPRSRTCLGLSFRLPTTAKFSPASAVSTSRFSRRIRPGGRCGRGILAARCSGLAGSARGGYTFGMKTAISLPDDVFERAENTAKRLKLSRSELYARALSEFLSRHTADEVTRAINEA